MKIIGHRGAAWLALENSLESIRLARRLGVDGIEFDVRMTTDKKFILSHDKNLRRVSTHKTHIHTSLFEDFLDVLLHNGEKVATLEQALQAAGTTPVFVEAKASGWAHPLARALRKRSATNTAVIARDHEELATFHELLPNIPVYLVQRFNPIDTLSALQLAHTHDFTGVDLNFWLLSPLTYWLAKRYELDIIVYSVNHIWIARFLRKLFPDITITSDRPDRLRALQDTSSPTKPRNG